MEKSITRVLSIACLLLLLMSCNYSSNKQFEEAKQCYDNNESEEAIQLLVLINDKSPHYAEAQQMLKQSYKNLCDSLWNNKQYDSVLAIVDTITAKSCFYGIGQFIIPRVHISKISSKWENLLFIEESDFEQFDKYVRQYQNMVDTISKNSDLIERKEMFDRELSCEYFVEYYYNITHKRYEDALMKLNKVNPEYVFGENVGIYDSLYQVVGILLYKERISRNISGRHLQNLIKNSMNLGIHMVKYWVKKR